MVTTNQIPPHRVSIRPLWHGEWIQPIQPGKPFIARKESEDPTYLYADSCLWAMAPKLSTAKLYYRFGNIQRERAETFQWYKPLAIENMLVRIEIGEPDDPAPRLWYGVIVDVSERRDGDQVEGRTGTQIFECVGLEYFLARTTLDCALVHGEQLYNSDSFSTGVEQLHAPTLIGKGLDFNLDKSLQFSPNCMMPDYSRSEPDFYFVGDADYDRPSGTTSYPTVRSYPRLTPSTAEDARFFVGPEAVAWSTWGILQYIVKYISDHTLFEEWHTRADLNPYLLPWKLDVDPSLVLFLDQKVEPVRAAGRSVKQVFDTILNRRRMLGWYVTGGTLADEQPTIHVVSLNREDAWLGTPPDESEIGPTRADYEICFPKNNHQIDWNFDQRANIEYAVIDSKASHKYDQVIVRGERPRKVFTAVYDGGGEEIGTDPTYISPWQKAKFLPSWTSEEEEKYKEGGSNNPDYSSLVRSLQQRANEVARREEGTKNVYRRFLLQTGTVGQIIAPAGSWPDDGTEADTVTHSTPFWCAGGTLLDYLPVSPKRLQEMRDTVERSAIFIQPTSRRWDNERSEPFAVVLTGESGGETRFDRLDTMSRAALLSGNLATGGTPWSAQLKMLEWPAGFEVVILGAPQHKIASQDFSGVDSADSTDDNKPEVDWRTMQLTLCVEGDLHLEARMPELPGKEFARTLTIDVPGYHFDYVEAGTVLGLSAEESDTTNNLILSGTTGHISVLRNDWPFLKQIADSAYRWYSMTRQAIRVTVTGDLQPVVQVGEMVRNIGSDRTTPTAAASEDHTTPVNSVVSQLIFDFQTPGYTVVTAFGELDISAL